MDKFINLSIKNPIKIMVLMEFIQNIGKYILDTTV